jgi:hypothetical protein
MHMSNLNEAPRFTHNTVSPIPELIGSIDVKPEPIPGITDEKIYAQASGDIPGPITWDNMVADYGFGIPADDLSLAQLRERFDYWYYATYPNKDGDDGICEPERFVEAIWEKKRQIPNLAEYADFLHSQDLLNPDEAERARLVMRIEALPEGDRYKRIDSMDEDERYYFDSIYAKLHYFINFHPDIAVANEELRRLAEKYTAKSLKAKEDHKYADAAWVMLMEARGLNEEEIKRTLTNRNLASRDSNSERHRMLGADPELAEKMAANAGGSILRPWQNPTALMDRALSGSLTTQLAVRKFLGIDNTYSLLTYQARLDRRFQGSPEAYRFAGSGLVGDYSNEPKSMFEEEIFSPEESSHFKALASLAVCEPTLKNYTMHLVRDEMMYRYLNWIELDQASQLD